jgi:hypothetical protein
VSSPTPTTLLQQAGDYGLKLGVHQSGALTVKPARLCTPEFTELLKAHKRALLALLRLPFIMMYSEIVNETIFFCEDEATKAALVEAGVDEWSIYTRDELRILVAQNRAKPFLPDELCKLHSIKRAFSGRISS